MCCILSGEPIEDTTGRIKTFNGQNRFQTDMMNAPFAECPWSCCWCLGQFIYPTGGCTQYCLRRKVLEGDMTKYQCCQGYYDGFCCGCFKSGACCEDTCPDLCLCIEGHCCNSCAISSSRIYVMEKYDLTSDPCDYRLIRFNNCMQALACICFVISVILPEFRELARCIDRIADLVYHCITGCMTAQVAHEVNYQVSKSQTAQVAHEVNYEVSKSQAR